MRHDTIAPVVEPGWTGSVAEDVPGMQVVVVQARRRCCPGQLLAPPGDGGPQVTESPKDLTIRIVPVPADEATGDLERLLEPLWHDLSAHVSDAQCQQAVHVRTEVELELTVVREDLDHRLHEIGSIHLIAQG